MFFGTRLYADTVLQVFFFATGVRGWWQWRHGGSGGGDLPISELSATARAAVVDAVASGTAIAGFVFSHLTAAAFPYADSFILSGSVVAQLLMMRRKLEHWPADRCKDRYAHTFVCAPDVPFEQDGTRVHPQVQQYTDGAIRNDLAIRGILYHVVRGSLESRIGTVLRVLDVD